MSLEPVHELTQLALRLRAMDKSVVKTIVEGRIVELPNLLYEYAELKKEIKTLLAALPIAQIQDQGAKDLLFKVSQEIPLEADKIIMAIEDQSGESLELEDLDDDEIDELGSKLFYSWISHYEYVRSLYQVGSLIVGFRVPEVLQAYVREVRESYALQQYNAVVALSRTILEAAIRHTCERRGLIQKSGQSVLDLEAYRPAELIRKVSSGAQRQRIQDLYARTSTLIHGQTLATADEALSTLKETLRVVHELYS